MRKTLGEMTGFLHLYGQVPQRPRGHRSTAKGLGDRHKRKSMLLVQTRMLHNHCLRVSRIQTTLTFVQRTKTIQRRRWHDLKKTAAPRSGVSFTQTFHHREERLFPLRVSNPTVSDASLAFGIHRLLSQSSRSTNLSNRCLISFGSIPI